MGSGVSIWAVSFPSGYGGLYIRYESRSLIVLVKIMGMGCRVFGNKLSYRKLFSELLSLDS